VAGVAAPPGVHLSAPDLEKAIAYVDALHKLVDGLIAPLEAAQGATRHCRRGCAGCCVDGLTVTAVEAALLQRRHASLFAEQAPHPKGACAILDAQGACRAYADRPYVCRTQGLPLRWADEGPDGVPVERRDVCPLNDPGGEALVHLPAADCWTLGPVEQRLGAAQALATPDETPRIALRSLFRREA
jgi:hypothetical protein